MIGVRSRKNINKNFMIGLRSRNNIIKISWSYSDHKNILLKFHDRTKDGLNVFYANVNLFIFLQNKNSDKKT